MSAALIRECAVFMGRSFDPLDQMKRDGRTLALPRAAKDGQVAKLVVDYADAIGLQVDMTNGE